MKRRIVRISLLSAIAVWTLSGPVVLAQNRTAVTVQFAGDSELRKRVEERLSALLTEINRASYFGEGRPDLPDQSVTQTGKDDLLRRWARARFRCPNPALTRTLREGRRNETYEVRSVPLLVETDSGKATSRSGIFVVDTRGRVREFLYQSERSARPETGTITIRTRPSEATVVSAIDGGIRKTSPARFEAVPADVYAFTIRKENYRSVIDTTFEIRARQSVEHTVRLAPTPGYLDLRALPEGATLRLDGTRRDDPGPGLQVRAGTLAVSVSKVNHTRWDSTLVVPSGDTVSVRPRLRPKKVDFIARSAPEGADVRLNGRIIGRTPVDTTVQAGRAYTLAFEKEGYLPSRTVRVVTSPDSTVDRRVVLTPIDVASNLETARFTNVQGDRAEGHVELTYALVGESDETYTVGLDLRGPGGRPLNSDSTLAKGAVGTGVSPGPDKRIVWAGPLPEGTTIRLTLARTGDGHGLLYVVGGAIVAGGGALAALLLSGGDDGGRSFPPPPGLPN